MKKTVHGTYEVLPTNAGTNNCRHCGHLHSGPCPRVKAIEYYPNGTVKRVEYTTPEPLKPIKIEPTKPYPWDTTTWGVLREGG